jgi:hypothetical protein
LPQAFHEWIIIAIFRNKIIAQCLKGCRTAVFLAHRIEVKADTHNIEKNVCQVFGIAPLKLEKMAKGRINKVYNVPLPDRDVVFR